MSKYELTRSITGPSCFADFPLLFGRCVRGAELLLFPPLLIWNGIPVWAVKMPLVCQPPTTKSSALGIAFSSAGAADRHVVVEADHQPPGDVLRRDRSLGVLVVVILVIAGRAQEADRLRSVVDQFAGGVAQQQLEPMRVALLACEDERLIIRIRAGIAESGDARVLRILRKQLRVGHRGAAQARSGVGVRRRTGSAPGCCSAVHALRQYGRRQLTVGAPLLSPSIRWLPLLPR